MKILRKIKDNKFLYCVVAVTIVKIVLSALCSSDYQNMMFRPFVQQFLQGIGTTEWNVYDFYYKNHMLSSFPYPPLMLFIESVGGLLLMLFKPSSVYVCNLLFKLPLLIFDIGCLVFLTKMFPNCKKYIGVLYYASPIVIYATYMHGQLDIIPTAFLIASLYFLTGREEKSGVSAIIFGLALLTKMHILAVLPIVGLYIMRRDGWKKMVGYLLRVAAVFVCGILPFGGDGLLYTVFLNAEQGAITKAYFTFSNGTEVYVSVLAVLCIYLVVYGTKRFNRELLLDFCGITFSVFLALCPPMPGWYIWIVPFIAVFFIGLEDDKYSDLGIYLLLNALYLVYFVFFHKTEYVDLYLGNTSLNIFKISSEVLGNLMFTLLAGTLIFVVFKMYQRGVISNVMYKRRNRSFAIGITGDSGSGKSTLVNLISNCLGNNNVLLIEGDGDHKWERGADNWKKYTHLDPKANYLYRQALNIEQLKKGVSVERVDYDHDTGKFTAKHKISSKRYLVFNGLHSLYLPQMRQAFDLKIYMDMDEKLRRYLKIKRDMFKRGYSQEEILKQIDSRVKDSESYILPQKKYADLIIHYFSHNLSQIDADEEAHLGLKVSLSTAVNMEPVIGILRKYGIRTTYDFEDNLDMQQLIFEEEDMQRELLPFHDIIEQVIPEIRDITKEKIKVSSNVDGVVLLVILKLISYNMENNV